MHCRSEIMKLELRRQVRAEGGPSERGETASTRASPKRPAILTRNHESNALVFLHSFPSCTWERLCGAKLHFAGGGVRGWVPALRVLIILVTKLRGGGVRDKNENGRAKLRDAIVLEAPASLGRGIHCVERPPEAGAWQTNAFRRRTFGTRANDMLSASTLI